MSDWGLGEAHRGTLQRLAIRFEQAVHADLLRGSRFTAAWRVTRISTTRTLHWFETELLSKEENLIGLMALNREKLGQAESLDGSGRVLLDMDSSESPVRGEQEG